MSSEYHQKNYVALEMEISALGYLQKVEGGILQKMKPTEHRWYGPLKQEEFDSQGRMIYRMSETGVQFM